MSSPLFPKRRHGPVQSASGGALGDTENRRYFGRSQLLPDDEQKDLTLIGREHGQHPADRVPLGFCVQPAVCVGPRITRTRKFCRGCGPGLLVPMGAQDVARNAVQPWEDIGGLPTGPTLEGS